MQTAHDAVVAAKQCADKADAAFLAANNMPCAASAAAFKKASDAAFAAVCVFGVARQSALQRVQGMHRRCGRLQYAEMKTLVHDANALRQAMQQYDKDGHMWGDLARRYEPVLFATTSPGTLWKKRGFKQLRVDTQRLLVTVPRR